MKMKNVDMDSLSPYILEDSMSEVYNFILDFNQTGWTDIQFINGFVWDGKSDILMAFKTNDQTIEGLNMVKSHQKEKMALTKNNENYYLHFSGGGDYVDLGSNEDIQGSTSRTIEVWARANAFNNGGLFQAGGTGTSQGDFSVRTMNNSANKWRLQLWGSDKDVVLDNSLNEWHHYAVTYDGNRVRMFYDGEKVIDEAVNLTTKANNIRFGFWSFEWNYFSGDIDEIRIWNKKLSSATLIEWMNKPVTPDHPEYSNLLKYCDFNENNGSEVLNIVDGSLNKLHGNAYWKTFDIDETGFELNYHNYRPNIVFEQGVYTSTIDSVEYITEEMNMPVRVFIYGNPDKLMVIDDDAPNHPGTVTDTFVFWEADKYTFTYDKIQWKSLTLQW
jgi:hypothetical protein